MAEFPDLGAQCALSTCRQLDFIPFTCHYCEAKYCEHHWKPEQHDCASYVDTSRRTDSVSVVPREHFECGVEGCSEYEVVPVQCSSCGLPVCLKHRHYADHDCIAIPMNRDGGGGGGGVVPSGRTSDGGHRLGGGSSGGGGLLSYLGFGKGKDKNKGKKAKGKKKKKKDRASEAVRGCGMDIGALREAALGRDSIPGERRFYLMVSLPSELVSRSKAPKRVPMFFDREWTVGRVLDDVADSHNVINENHRNKKKKLYLFSGYTGVQLPNDIALELFFDSLVNGDIVILERVPTRTDRLPSALCVRHGVTTVPEEAVVSSTATGAGGSASSSDSA